MTVSSLNLVFSQVNPFFQRQFNQFLWVGAVQIHGLHHSSTRAAAVVGTIEIFFQVAA